MTNFYKTIFYCFSAGAIASAIYWVYLLLPIEKYNSYSASDPEYILLALLLTLVNLGAAGMSFISYKYNKIRETK